MSENVERVKSALESIPCAELEYDKWLNIGMALHADGQDVSVWEEWSRTDLTRYKDGDCLRRWNGFHSSPDGVTIATLFKEARDRGWNDKQRKGYALDWNAPQKTWQPDPTAPYNGVADLERYLSVLFTDSDNVS